MKLLDQVVPPAGGQCHLFPNELLATVLVLVTASPESLESVCRVLSVSELGQQPKGSFRGKMKPLQVKKGFCEEGT